MRQVNVSAVPGVSAKGGRQSDRDTPIRKGRGEMKASGVLFGTACGVLLLALAACGGDGDSRPDPGGVGNGPPDNGGTGGLSIAWGPRLDTSNLSPIVGAKDAFGPEVIGALMDAAKAVPAGASQSSWGENGRTSDEISVHVVRDDDGNLVHEVTDEARLFVRVPSSVPRRDVRLALFTTLQPGIEPDLSSFPHEVLGIWASDGEAAAFWSMSPSIPEVSFGATSPTGTATYEGDAVGLHSDTGAVTKFLADVEMVADFGAHTVGGSVDAYRDFSGKSLGDLTVTLGEADFSQQGNPFSDETSGASGSDEVAGSGKWGARWSDGEGWTMGGTFGFAADDESMAVLGAFTACSCASIDGGSPDDPVSMGP